MEKLFLCTVEVAKDKDGSLLDPYNLETFVRLCIANDREDARHKMADVYRYHVRNRIDAQEVTEIDGRKIQLV